MKTTGGKTSEGKKSNWRRRTLLALTAAVAALVFSVTGVSAASSYTFVETDVAEPSDGCVMLGVYGSYYADDAEAALARINEIRYEACTDGKTPDPRNPSRMLTASDYVQIKWSTALEKIARIRAVEGGLAVGHTRYNGGSVFGVSFGGITGSAEDLAYNWQTTMVYGIEQWYGERDDWLAQDDSKVTGHYTSMIDPSYTYVGLGDFYTKAAAYSNTLAAQMSNREGSLGTGFLEAPKDIMQKIEVRTDYIDKYLVDGSAEMYIGAEQTVEAKAQVTPPPSSSGTTYRTTNIWVIDEVAWSSSDESVATVASDGTVKGLAKGTVTITASSGGKVLGSLDIQVVCNHQYEFGEPDSSGKCHGVCTECGDTIDIVPPTKYSIWWKKSDDTSGSYSSVFPSDVKPGDGVLVWVTVNDGDSGYQDVVIESSDPSVAEIVEGGYRPEIKVLKAGITVISIYPKYNPSVGKTNIMRFGDESSVDIGDMKITLSEESYDYNGTAREPKVTVSAIGCDLVQNQDYTVTYENNVNAGTAKAVITGKGIFGGSVEREFEIKALSIKDAAVELSQTSYECDGTEKEPEVTVKLGSTQLKKGTDFTVEYEGNRDPGEATATITGIGNYTGEVVRAFTMQHSEHSYDEEITKVATCGEAGSKTLTCRICGDTKDEEIPATGQHTAVTDAEVPASCTETGLTEGSHCGVCGLVLVEQTVIPAKGHSFGEWVDKRSSCTESGYKERECEVCHLIEKEDVEAGEHTWSKDYIVDQEATCTVDGSRHKVCTVCNAPGDAEVIHALGHEPVTDKTVAATCTADGLTEGSHCSRCSEVLTAQETVPALGHEPVTDEAVAATCTTDGLTEGSHCSRCSEVLTAQETVPALGHDPEDESVVVQKATFKADGLEVRYCKRCGETADEMVIPQATAELAATAYTYNGKVRKPGLTVNEGLATDEYTVTWSKGRKNVGTYTATVTLTGERYEGSLKRSFKINPKGATIKAPKALKKGFTAKWAKQASKMSAARITGYQVQYSTSAKFKSGNKTVTVKGYVKTSAKVTKLKAKKKYYIRVRTYMKVGGKTYYSTWSKVKSVKTR